MSAPASARAIATAWPMPLVPPVMRAVCPSREKRALVVGDMVTCCTPELSSHTIQSSEWVFVHDGFLYGEVAKALSLSLTGRSSLVRVPVLVTVTSVTAGCFSVTIMRASK